MGKYRRIDNEPGWINRRNREQDRRTAQQRAEKRLQAATIGAGGLTVKDGGSVTIKDNGAFSAQYPNGQESARFGPARTADGRVTQALTIRDEAGDVVFSANRTPYDAAFPAYPDGQRVVQAGGLSNAIDLLYFHVGGTAFTMDASTGAVSIAGTVQLGYTTTAAAANCVIGVDGTIQRSTSSRRYKRDITDAEVDVDQALQLTPRKFRMKSDEGEDAPEYVGFIAEEAHALGLDAWVSCDDEGPESFAYATWPVALQAIAQRQAAQIADLTARLDALEGHTTTEETP